MISPEFQAQVELLLVRHGLRDEAGDWGFEVVPSKTTDKFDSLEIRSISERKVKPYTEWWGGSALLTIRLTGTKRLNAKIISWQPRAFPFLWMPARVDSSGVDVTLTILDRAFKVMSEKLRECLDGTWGIPGTPEQQAALATVFFATANSRLVGRYIKNTSLQASTQAIEWIEEGISADLIVYAFANPFTFSTLVRNGTEPFFTLEDAQLLGDISLHTIASLYPLDESVADPKWKSNY